MFRNKKQFGLCLIIFLGLLHTGFASAAVLSLNPSSVNVVESNSFDVDVIISDLGGATVGAFDFTIGYDPSLLSATNVAFSGNLGSTDPFDFETDSRFSIPTPGSLRASETSLFFDFELDLLRALQPGDVVRLATLSFMADAAGSTFLSFTARRISDEFGVEIPITEVAGAAVDISPVPLPGALWMMFSALLGIGAIARQRGPVK